ncbi:hypothetical protein HUK82_10645, partial [Ameyamaea chiangmaiensis]|nr:hypothetical protein [Ameyamaea chiangmaiensis]
MGLAFARRQAPRYAAVLLLRVPAAMPIDRSTLPHSHGARASTSALFFVTGAVVAAWGVLVPFVRMRAHLDHKTLGALLLCVGLGALAGMPASGLL